MLKEKIKRSVSEIFYLREREAVLSRRTYRVMLYHSVCEPAGKEMVYTRISPDDFKAQMEFLKADSYNVIPLSEMVEGIKKGAPIAPKTIAITFDDGYRDFLENALSVLNNYGFPVTVFISPGVLSGKIKGKDVRFTADTLDREELLILKNGGVDIGSHGYSHRDLTDLKSPELFSEVAQSKDILERALGRGIKSLSYPFGRFNRRVMEAVRRAGYEYALSTVLTSFSNQVDLFNIPRTEIMSDSGDLREFSKMLSGCYDWLRFKRAEFWI